jgi:hypothetical protein
MRTGNRTSDGSLAVSFSISRARRLAPALNSPRTK